MENELQFPSLAYFSPDGLHSSVVDVSELREKVGGKALFEISAVTSSAQALGNQWLEGDFRNNQQRRELWS